MTSPGVAGPPEAPVIRDATALDLDAVTALQPACFPHDPWSRAMVAGELDKPGGVFLVAEVGGVLAGFAIGLVVADQIEVLQVAVDPARRRLGLGRRLMEALHAAAPHQDVAFLEVRADNDAARALYTGMGYAELGTRRRYYPDGCDAIVMRRELRG